MRKNVFIHLMLVILMLINVNNTFSEGQAEASSPGRTPGSGTASPAGSSNKTGAAVSSGSSLSSSGKLGKDFTVHSSDPMSGIYIDGEKTGTGAAKFKGSEPVHSVLITHPDYDDFQAEIKAESVSHYKAGTAFSCFGAGIGGICLMLALPFSIMSVVMKDSDVPEDREAAENFGKLSIPLLAGGTAGLLAPLLPVKRWKSDYYADVSSLSHYNDAGFHEVTGFNIYGVNSKGFFKDGSRFSGRIVEGKKSGYGVYTKLDGEKITGNFTNDKLNGYGRITDTDGSRSYGRWYEGRRGGPSVLIKKDGSQVYQFWKADIMTSSFPRDSKVLSYRYKWVFLGRGSSNGFASGTGDAVTEDLKYSIQKGTFVNGRLTSGSLIYPDRTVFSGTFQNDYLVSGKVQYPDRSRYEGQLKNNIPDGKGTLYFKNGGSYTGYFRNGKFNGNGKLVKASGESYEGPFVNGKPHGKGYYKYGTLSEKCEYSYGKRVDKVYLARLERERLAREEKRKKEEERLRQLELEEKREEERLAAEEKKARESRPVEVEKNDWAVAGLAAIKKIQESAGTSDMGNPVYAKTDYMEIYRENKKKRDEEKARIKKSLESSSRTSSSRTSSAGRQSDFSEYSSSVPAVSSGRTQPGSQAVSNRYGTPGNQNPAVSSTTGGTGTAKSQTGNSSAYTPNQSPGYSSSSASSSAGRTGTARSDSPRNFKPFPRPVKSGKSQIRSLIDKEEKFQFDFETAEFTKRSPQEGIRSITVKVSGVYLYNATVTTSIKWENEPGYDNNLFDVNCYIALSNGKNRIYVRGAGDFPTAGTGFMKNSCGEDAMFVKSFNGTNTVFYSKEESKAIREDIAYSDYRIVDLLISWEK